MNRQYFDRIFLEAIDQLRKGAPKDSGNLAYNAIKYRWTSKNIFEIYVDVGEVKVIKKKIIGIAPYMPFTNEVWISPKWKGKTNPNQNWWNKLIEMVIRFIAKRMGGELI